jgi:hypothetical protein
VLLLYTSVSKRALLAAEILLELDDHLRANVLLLAVREAEILALAIEMPLNIGEYLICYSTNVG